MGTLKSENELTSNAIDELGQFDFVPAQQIVHADIFRCEHKRISFCETRTKKRERTGNTSGGESVKDTEARIKVLGIVGVTSRIRLELCKLRIGDSARFSGKLLDEPNEHTS